MAVSGPEPGTGPGSGSRIVIQLPTENAGERKAAIFSLDYVKKVFGGATRSKTGQGSFTEFRHNSVTNKMQWTAVCLVLIDTYFDANDGTLLLKAQNVQAQATKEYLLHASQSFSSQRSIFVTVVAIKYFS